ncbi:phenylalanine 4-monooxygenase, partial [Paraburkholderia sp. JHI2823]
YFVIDDLAQLFGVAQTDFAPLLARLANAPAYAAGDLVEGDCVITRGTRDGWHTSGDV